MVHPETGSAEPRRTATSARLRVGVLAAGDALAHTVAVALPTARVREATDLDSWLRSDGSERTDLRIYEAGFDGDAVHPAVLPMLVGGPAPLLVTLTGTAVGTREASQMIRIAGPHVMFAVATADAIGRAVAEWRSGRTQRSPVPELVRHLADDFPVALRLKLLVGAVLAQHEGGVSRWARLVACDPATLRSWCREGGVAAPVDIIGAARACVAVQRSVESGMDLHDVAWLGGFTDASACSHAVRRHTARSLREWRSAGGFAGALAEARVRCRRGWTDSDSFG